MHPTIMRPVITRRTPATAAHRAMNGAVWGGMLLGSVAALLLFAPARWLATGVAQATGGRVLLTDARGTVWAGSGQLVLTGGPASQEHIALPGRLDWRLQPGLRGLSAELNAPCCMQTPLQAQARLEGAGLNFALAVGDHPSRWPASLLAGLGTPWNTVQAQGLLAVTTQGVRLQWARGRMALTGQVQVDAQDMASRLSTLRPMGSYRVLLQGGDLVRLQLSTLQGSLQLEGAGQWVGGRLHFDGVASSTPERQDALANLLNIIGRRDGARSLIKVG
jgi:general secretion pathway protein N